MEPTFGSPIMRRIQDSLAKIVGGRLRERCTALFEDVTFTRNPSGAERLCRLVLGPHATCDATPLPDGRWLAEIEYDHVLHDGCGSDETEAVLAAMGAALDGIDHSTARPVRQLGPDQA